jgi:anti-sigma factor RsiW
MDAIVTERDGAVHVDANDLAAYVEDRLDGAERARVEAHLADCADCRADAVAALRARSRPGAAWRWTVPALAAAVILVLAVPRARRTPVAVDHERGAPPATVQLVAPDIGVVLPLADVQLVWRSVAAGTDYRVTVTGEDGTRIYAMSTRDTVVDVPSTSLRPAGRYLWTVDALRPDGTPLSSGGREFATRP